MADDDTRNEEESGSPRGWSPHPHERMLITPLVAGLGGLLAFFTVVFIVVWLPIHTFDPPASYDWTPLSNAAVKGRNLFAENGCYVCHSGYSRPQDVREALYFLYPKVSQPGDFYGSDQSPNLLGTERTGPDLSQESGWHPDDWQRAHFYDPRFVDPLSLMPAMKSLFSNTQIEHLITYVETRSGKSGLLRYAGQLYSKHVVTTNQGFSPAPTGFGGAHSKILEGHGTEPRTDRPRLLALRRPVARDRAEPAARQGGLPAALRRLSRHRRRRQRPRRELHVAGARGLHQRRRCVLRRRHRAWRFLLPDPSRLARNRNGELR
jgi:cbb3-type cytochrome oxidase cytochrome c subunit